MLGWACWVTSGGSELMYTTASVTSRVLEGLW